MLLNQHGTKNETYYICGYCLAEDIRQLAPDGLDYCGSCEAIVEGNTLKCIRELDNVDVS